MRKTPSSTPSAAPKANAVAPSLTLFDAPPSRVPKPKAPAAKAAPLKTTKKIPVQAVSSKPASVRVVAETAATYFTGGGGRAWRMSGKHAVAYVQNAVLAGELLATEPRHLAKAAMAVYYDRKGKPFAWQFRFDTTRWEEVVERLA
jgi:hypothetical protein